MKVIAVLLLALATASAGTLPQPRPVHPRDRTEVQSIESRIVGGHTALPGQFPYQIGIVFYWDIFGWFCGGSLISEKWALTAAHCTDGADGADIYAGCILLQSGVKQNVSSKNFRQHPKYDSWLITNDISLIELEKPMKFGLFIKKIGLPSLTGPHDTYVDEKATVSGWGVTSNTATSQPLALQFVVRDVISNNECGKSYPGFIEKSHICTSVTGGQSTCYGDSGGPLVIDLKKKPVQIGIVSFGSSLGCTEAPSAYTRLTSYVEWIKETSGISC